MERKSVKFGYSSVVLKSGREPGIETMRILLMVAITANHVVGHGLGMDALEGLPFSDPRAGQYVKLLIMGFVAPAVDSFVLISGWYGIRFRSRAILQLVAQGLAYSWLIDLLAPRLGLANTVVGPWQYWFLEAYFCLYLVAPFMNRMFEALDRREHLVFMGLASLLMCVFGFHPGHRLLGLNQGFSAMQLFYIYALGRTLARFQVRLPPWKAALGTVMASSSAAVIAILDYHVDDADAGREILQNNGPLIVLSATCTFLLFKNLGLSRSIPAWIGPHVFGIYLIHENPAVRVSAIGKWVPLLIGRETPWLLLEIPIGALCIFVAFFPVCLVVDETIALLWRIPPVAWTLSRIDQLAAVPPHPRLD